MKIITITTCVLSFCHLGFAQESNRNTLFQTNSKSQFHYVDLDSDTAFVYEMGRYIDKAGTGPSIRNTDTLTRQPDGTYLGKSTGITRVDNRVFLLTKRGKGKTIRLDTVKSLNNTNYTLNNAYYLDNYFKMCKELRQLFPLYHFSFRSGFHDWKTLPNKEMAYLQFRQFVHKELEAVKDSIIQVQDRNVALTNFIIENLETIDYSTLKDSLMKLPAEGGYLSHYYGRVVNEVAKQRPEYFFRLAQEFPQNQDLIFSSAGDDKDVIKNLKAVEGYDATKKAFFKDRKFSKSLPYKIVGMYAVVAGLIVLLISSQ